MMNKNLVMNKDYLVPLLRKLAKTHRLVAPVRNEYGDTLFTLITDLDKTEIDLDHQTQASLKPYFFPQADTLCRYALDREPGTGAMDYSFHAQLPQNLPTVYFGVRSCDMFAVMYTDMVFLHEHERDIYYKQRRDNAIFITIACNTPFDNCFCNATRSGPFLESGFDLQLTDLGDRWFVDTGRARGTGLAEDWACFFRPATEADKRAQFQAELEARGLFKQLVHVELASKLLAEDKVPESIFSDLSRRCQDCGGCAFICPTCTCFNITDQPLNEAGGERVRSWDACTFSGFTAMAGGHNSVDVETGRISRRFRHKLQYDVDKHGRPSCVGCGRCVGMCFGGVDMIRFISMISEAGENGAEAGG